MPPLEMEDRELLKLFEDGVSTKFFEVLKIAFAAEAKRSADQSALLKRADFDSNEAFFEKRGELIGRHNAFNEAKDLPGNAVARLLSEIAVREAIEERRNGLREE